MSEEKIANIEADENAELEAAADSTVKDKGEDVLNVNERISYVIPLSKAYDLEGKVIKEVDLSGLEDLTTADGEYIERVMAKMNYHPNDKFRDITYTKHIAMKVTGLPIEFFNMLKWKDLNRITSRIAVYFLY